MPQLLLDEGLSPSISVRLWAEGFDNYPLRDRGMLGLADHEIWHLANQQGRAVVTINGSDFRRLARRMRDHAGLVIIPSGGTRNDHFHLVMRGLRYARPTTETLPTLLNQIVEVLPSGEVRVEHTTS